ncbi:asparaginase [Natrinema salifodinae]|uniref:L-asparaginase n=1 Tax=Natrinema salifodinae TaxID=1202768 RepID=A0A1I0QJW3_9EURY|nr:asparaginase [Natrinema salifodinae]SEW27412.1 L-asparaginase [Natrinema salifodinae]
MYVTVLSTGGTIASTGGDDGATPTRRGRELVDAVPALAEYADVDVEQVAQVPSYEMDAETLESIGDRVRELDGDEDVDAVVVTHGTDTLEETAYYLDVAVGPATPVFATGAQRRPDEYSADGPSNLLTAVRAADAFRDREGDGVDDGDGSDDRGCGVFVAFNEEIHAARRVTKTHTSKLETFRSVATGPVATVGRDGVAIHRPLRSESTRLPTDSLAADVYTIKSGSCATGDLVDAAIAAGADGLVLEATGIGNATKGIGTAVRDAIREGIPVVVASRCLEGRTAPVYGGVGGGDRLREYGAIFAGDLPAQKARIKLTLALTAFDDEDAVRRAFAD